MLLRAHLFKPWLKLINPGLAEHLKRLIFVLRLQIQKYFSLDFGPWVFNQTFISFNNNYYSFLRCEAILGEFLRGIKSEPKNVNFAHMVNILVLYSQPEGKN